MALGDGLRKFVRRYFSKGPDLQKITIESMRVAAERAVEVATAETPPTPSTPPRGANAFTGRAKAAWATDSDTEPKLKNGEYKTSLANNVEYIQYLNDGFMMDKHFVPGLVINEYSGLLDKLDPSAGGIIVGTQTEYVQGLYMKEKAERAYKETLDSELSQRLEDWKNGK